MREHGVRERDIDRVREAMVNAVFYVSEAEEANRLVEEVGYRLGLQRRGVPGR